MPQEQPLPTVGVRAVQLAQRIERELVMRAAGVRGIQDAEKQVHGALAGGESFSWRKDTVRHAAAIAPDCLFHDNRDAD